MRFSKVYGSWNILSNRQMKGQRRIQLTIQADKEIVKPDVFDPYFASRGDAGQQLEDQVDAHLVAQNLTPLRRFDSDRSAFDVDVTGPSVAIPDLTTTIDGVEYVVKFRDPTSGGRRRVKTFRRTTRRPNKKNGRGSAHQSKTRGNRRR